MYRAKSCTSVFLASKFLFVSSGTFALDVSFSHKRVEENANVSFFEIDNRACIGCVTLCYSLTCELWSVTLERIEFECVHKLNPLTDRAYKPFGSLAATGISLFHWYTHTFKLPFVNL